MIRCRQMHPVNHGDPGTPEGRRITVARLLAAGIMRDRTRGLPVGVTAKQSGVRRPDEVDDSPLELSAETVLSVHTG